MTILDSLLTKHFNTPIDKKQRKKILLSTLRHVLRIETSSQHKETLRKVYGAESRVIDFQRDLSNTGYIIKNLKLFLVYHYNSKLFGVSQLLKPAKLFGLKVEDAKLINLLREDTDALTKLDKLCKKLEKPLTVKEMDSLLISVNSKLFTYTSKFAGRKLRFATLGSHLRIDDIASELRLLGMQGLLKAYPQMDSELHALNIAKRTIHNQGINMIHHFTSQGRCSLVREDDGTFSSLKVSLDVFDESSGPTECSVAVSLDGSTVSAGDATSDLSMTYKRLIKAHKGSKKKFIKLLAGHYSPSFSRWLTKNSTYIEQNDELFDRLQRRGSLSRYINLVSDYLGMSRSDSTRFLTELKEGLA
ncbi:hypothetical protein GR11A_00038 [Vibrio phage vB_VcorM_GR11A]|nr:hypothetical protein GR11A_00038 [Vibrio phage vB_VcorM_GR11A]